MGLSSSRRGHDTATCHAVFRSLEEVVVERSSRVKPADQMEIIQRCQVYDPEVGTSRTVSLGCGRSLAAGCPRTWHDLLYFENTNYSNNLDWQILPPPVPSRGDFCLIWALACSVLIKAAFVVVFGHKGMLGVQVMRPSLAPGELHRTRRAA